MRTTSCYTVSDSTTGDHVCTGVCIYAISESLSTRMLHSRSSCWHHASTGESSSLSLSLPITLLTLHRSGHGYVASMLFSSSPLSHCTATFHSSTTPSPPIHLSFFDGVKMVMAYCSSAFPLSFHPSTRKVEKGSDPFLGDRPLFHPSKLPVSLSFLPLSAIYLIHSSSHTHTASPALTIALHFDGDCESLTLLSSSRVCDSVAVGECGSVALRHDRR